MTKEERAIYGAGGVVALTTAAGLLFIAFIIDRNVKRVDRSLNAGVDRLNNTINNLPTNLARVIGVLR
jgi:hypothetical protein